MGTQRLWNPNCGTSCRIIKTRRVRKARVSTFPIRAICILYSCKNRTVIHHRCVEPLGRGLRAAQGAAAGADTSAGYPHKHPGVHRAHPSAVWPRAALSVTPSFFRLHCVTSPCTGKPAVGRGRVWIGEKRGSRGTIFHLGGVPGRGGTTRERGARLRSRDRWRRRGKEKQFISPLLPSHTHRRGCFGDNR